MAKTTPSVGGKYIQVDQRDFDQVVTDYKLLLARNKKQDLQLKALTKVSQFAAQTEGALKIEKKRSKQYESAYVASEAKLGYLIKNLLLKKEERPPDVEILESLLGLKTEELYTGSTDKDITLAKQKLLIGDQVYSPESQSGKTTAKQDLEVDGVMGSAPKIKKQVAKKSGPNTWDETTDEMSPVKCVFEKEDLKLFTNSEPQNIHALLQQKKQLQNIIREFQEQDGDAWTSYIEFKRYEDIVKSLRMEVASLKINCTELHQLLAAKRGNQTDELSVKALEFEKQVERLKKEARSKHEMLESVNSEIRQLRETNQQLRARLGVGRPWQEELGQEYERIKLEVERLKTERQELEQECQKYRRVLENVQSPVPIDPPMESWSELWDQKQKLESNIESYRHEIEQKDKTLKLNQAEFQILQDKLSTMKEDISKVTESLKAKETKVQLLQSENGQLQRQFNLMHEQFQRMTEDNQRLKRDFDRMKMIQAQPSHYVQQPLTRGMPFTGGITPHCRGSEGISQYNSPLNRPSVAQFAGGSLGQRPMIEADGATEDSSSNDSSGRERVTAARTPNSFPQTKQPYTGRQTERQMSGYNNNTVPSKQQYPSGVTTASVLKQQPTTETVLECPQCLREFKPSDRDKFEEHKKKCMH